MTPLLPHPTTPEPPARSRVEAEFTRTDTTLHLRATITPALPLLVPGGPATRRDEIWKQTCVELFFGREGDDAYWEVNAAPGGGWNVYAFDGERRGMREEGRVKKLAVETRWPGQEPGLSAGSLGMTVEVPMAPLGISAGEALEVGVAAVLVFEEVGATYWAWAHPGPAPDFHRRDGWGPGPSG